MNKSMTTPEDGLFEITVETDPTINAAAVARHETASRNWDWLAENFRALAKGNEGRYVCVAGQQAFIADDPDEARRLATEAHPTEAAVICHRFLKTDRASTHANRRPVV